MSNGVNNTNIGILERGNKVIESLLPEAPHDWKQRVAQKMKLTTVESIDNILAGRRGLKKRKILTVVQNLKVVIKEHKNEVEQILN